MGALLELGAGFHRDLTGAENLRIHAALMGLTRHETDRKFEEIVEFSGVREFIQQPLRTYSSGMILRLAFAVAVGVAPDILLIDEIIGVGDQAFQEKAQHKIQELRRAGHTILLASHTEELLTSLCDRALWLDRGRVRMLGTVREVFAAYRAGGSLTWNGPSVTRAARPAGSAVVRRFFAKCRVPAFVRLRGYATASAA